MATDAPVNGNYAQHHAYGEQHNPYAAQQSYNQAPPSASSAGSNANGQNSDIPKDEVGWYFVEQYYTTLSKQPEHLYLYYNKRSQFVSGSETDKVQVCIGQRAINDRIKELDFQDCKVRITNVDSQASDANIVIQVIGEISNKSQPHRKFTQTFVLAVQTNGYFVLNDIFRYIIEEEDEAEPQPETSAQAEDIGAAATEESAPSEVQTEPKTLTSSSEVTAIEHDAQVVDQEIEKKLLNPSAEANGTHQEPETVPEVEETEVKVTETPERPTEPEPTPAPSPPKQTPAQPAAPKPVIPKTWASMAASANKSGTGPKVPVPAAAPQQKTANAKAATPAAAQPASPVPSNAAPAAEAAPAVETQEEWTAVGGNHTRQQSRQVNGQQTEGAQRKAYIKNIGENIQQNDLREALEKFGKITHIDIVRPRNCAFVDFETPEAYQAAVAANPHAIGNESLYVDERKVRPANGQFQPRGQFQGARGGRGDFRGGRGGRGDFGSRGRGQAQGRGGRGGAQQA